jgi:hypothetical protein
MNNFSDARDANAAVGRMLGSLALDYSGAILYSVS